MENTGYLLPSGELSSTPGALERQKQHDDEYDPAPPDED